MIEELPGSSRPNGGQDAGYRRQHGNGVAPLHRAWNDAPPLSLHRRVDQAAHQRAEIFALAGSL